MYGQLVNKAPGPLPAYHRPRVTGDCCKRSRCFLRAPSPLLPVVAMACLGHLGQILWHADATLADARRRSYTPTLADAPSWDLHQAEIIGAEPRSSGLYFPFIFSEMDYCEHHAEANRVYRDHVQL
jgi:hypothetical protein